MTTSFKLGPFHSWRGLAWTWSLLLTCAVDHGRLLQPLSVGSRISSFLYIQICHMLTQCSTSDPKQSLLLLFLHVGKVCWRATGIDILTRPSWKFLLKFWASQGSVPAIRLLGLVYRKNFLVISTHRRSLYYYTARSNSFEFRCWIVVISNTLWLSNLVLYNSSIRISLFKLAFIRIGENVEISVPLLIFEIIIIGGCRSRIYPNTTLDVRLTLYNFDYLLRFNFLT